MSEKIEVSVTDIDVPFGSMVTILVKLALASIPAILILALFGTAFFMFIRFFFGR